MSFTRPFLPCAPLTCHFRSSLWTIETGYYVMRIYYQSNLYNQPNFLPVFSLLCLQPLDMNSVEWARHNLSESLPDMKHLFEPLPLQQLLWPWGGGEVRNGGPNCDIYSSCSAVVLKQRSNFAITPQTCLCNIWFVRLERMGHTLALITRIS